jgi:hypothetical protein
MDFFAWLKGAAPVILVKNGLWISANRQATNLADGKPCPTRSDLARQVAEEYASDLREIINKLTKSLSKVKLQQSRQRRSRWRLPY